VVDPRFNKSATKANKYLPIIPGTDAAFFAALIQWIVKNKRYDATYLANANKAAAMAAGEPTWTNAVLLVKLDKEGNPGKFLRAHEIGLAQPEKRTDKDGKEHDFEYLVAMKDGASVAVDPNDETVSVIGDLLVDTEIRGIKVKSALQVVADSADSKSVAEWSKICGISVKDIEQTANELTSYGKRAVVDIHRGVAQHTNGFYNVASAMTINLLLGNFDHKGGMIAASTYNVVGDKEGQPFNLGKMAPGKTSKFGISIIRHDIKYEDSTIFDGYPAKRNWWPLASDIYEEIIPSIGDAYPYPVKAVFSYMGTPAYALPAGHTNIGILADVNKIPLYFATDIVVGTSTMYADYIFPDLSYLERWEMQGSHPNMPAKVQPVRQPVIAPIPEPVNVFGEEMPCCFESVILALAEKLGVKGYGKDGFGPAQDFTRPEDFYIRMVANLAADGATAPDADDAEMRLFLDSRKHLPKSVFDPERWEAIAGPAWRKAVYILNRGGRFQEYGDIYKGDLISNQYKSLINMYQEKTAGTKSAFTGKSNPGCAMYIPVSTTMGKSPKESGFEDGYPL
ncbi:MAG: molybdopterin-dependent oxidoreductase, partial [Candidatus Lindowbacteria bacterium]|nr:molybdopterin-dependent oxidoreductase [Candidatus Lindowbacteria bacterium]